MFRAVQHQVSMYLKRVAAQFTGTASESLGKRGERAAARLLKSKGYQILERSQRTSFGELDLIALDGRTIVFVEVKTRATMDPQDPIDGVTWKKQQQLTRLALAFLKKNGLLEHAARFDIIGINWPNDAQHPTIRHYENAFEPTGTGQMFS
jgi:putative endonuclease